MKFYIAPTSPIFFQPYIRKVKKNNNNINSRKIVTKMQMLVLSDILSVTGVMRHGCKRSLTRRKDKMSFKNKHLRPGDFIAIIAFASILSCLQIMYR